MAHGSKKWIVAYDGKVKRSNDRTKKDYYRDLHWWDEYEYRFRRYAPLGRRKKQNDFCPQCKHVQKPIIAEEEEARVSWNDHRAEYDKLFGDANRQWEAYRKKCNEFWTDGYGHIHYKFAFPPKMPEPPSYYVWNRKNSYYRGWTYNSRSYLCYKHERMMEVKDKTYYRDTYGTKRTWARRQEYKDYRSEVKTLMQKAKYDEEYYEDICPKKKAWLD